MTDAPKMAPGGSWKSPITSELISQSITLTEVRMDNGQIYWLEGRPLEHGRQVVVREDSATDGVDVTPKPFNARTRVHEYGGGAWLVAGGTVFFSNFADGRLYRQDQGAEPQPLTPAPGNPARGVRYADGLIDRRRQRWIGVCEDHTREGEPVNAIVAVGVTGTPSCTLLVGGHDFFASPTLSPDGGRLAWLAWDHPNMPWNGTTLYLAELDEQGNPRDTRMIAGGIAESIFQPQWTPDGSAIVYVSDRSGWWNLYRRDLASGETAGLAPMAAEFGHPQWTFAMSTYAFAGSDRILCSYIQNGLGRLALLDLAGGRLRDIETPFTDFASVRAEGNHAVFRAGAPNQSVSVVALDLGTGAHRVVKKANDLLDRADLCISEYLAPVRPIEFPTTGGNTARGLYYPPHNPDYTAPAGEKPPLLVKCHGGPTSAASSTLSLHTQYWTSRGIAVLDVNYGGSTGFGRAYRDRLHESWGIVDVDDCVNGARFLAERGLVDPQRMAITGGSAGGYTTLAALAFRDVFAGGASHYGVSDLAALARDTHKFESRYLDWLIGPYPQDDARYRERSPVHHAERIRKPVIFFQGDEDGVVPPDQTEMMVEALRRRGTPVGFLLFSGEQHGFRRGGNIQRSLDAELYFYSIEVFKTALTF